MAAITNMEVEVEGHTEAAQWPESWQGLTEGSSSQPLDLKMLWHVLEKHKEVMKEKGGSGSGNTTWELVVVQGVILTVLVLISVMWAVCCRKRCFSQDDSVSVAEALRKLSRDMPPSYSTRDLHTLGISVNDHLHPPPAYLELFKDDLQYLDLEAGHSRMAKLSFCSGDGAAPRLARVSVASCASCSSESAVVVPVAREERRVSLNSSTPSSSSSSRRSSRGLPSAISSRASSRVSFSEEVECSNGSIRRLSTPSRKSSSSSSEGSRKTSSSSDGSRKSSLIAKVQQAKRKFGSQGSINAESFMSQLDTALRTKLETIGDPDPVPVIPVTLVTPSLEVAVEKRKGGEVEVQVEVERTPETQAERAARVCDIIHEER